MKRHEISVTVRNSFRKVRKDLSAKLFAFIDRPLQLKSADAGAKIGNVIKRMGTSIWFIGTKSRFSGSLGNKMKARRWHQTSAEYGIQRESLKLETHPPRSEMILLSISLIGIEDSCTPG